jgi:TonB family protein
MTAAAVSFRTPFLAWDIAPADEQRFKRILRTVVLASAAVCAVLLLMPRPAEERVRVEPLPPRLAKLILEREVPPAVVPKPIAEVKPKPVEAPKVEPKPADKPVVEKAIEKPVTKPVDRDSAKPEPKAPVPEARNPLPDRAAGEIEGARRKAAGVGLLAMKDTLAELHSAPMAAQLKDVKPGPGVGTGTGAGVGAGTEAGLPTRALITSNATNGSGGINTAAFSRDTGGGGLAGRSSTLVEGVAGGGGGGGAGGGGKAGARGNGTGDGLTGGGKGGTMTKGGGAKASRSIEDIKLVFDRNKGAIYALYNRALRDDAALQGKVVLELKIAPEGQVIGCRVVSSELKSPELEAKLVARIRMFDFGAKEVEPMVVTWPVDFLPS